MTEFNDKTTPLANEEDVALPNQRPSQARQHSQPKRPRRRIGEVPHRHQSPKMCEFAEGLNPIAIVGMAGRFPQAGSPAALWDLLVAETDAISDFPYWGLPGIDARSALAKDFVTRGGFIAGATHFDADFFQLSAREVQAMDPQQRVLIETTWAALESAAMQPSALRGSHTGVFIGVSAADYNGLLAQSGVGAHDATGNAHSIMANRLSYLFDFNGPSSPIDTACSSSLVAIHRAAQALIHGDCSLAVAGGVNLCFEPMVFVGATKAGMLSPKGRCHTFSDQADGYVRGEGVGVLILKPFHQAWEDGDPILATLLASSENHGGHASSLTAPNVGAQSALLKQAYKHIDVNSLGYIEAHGTGTKLGDPIEIRALTDAFEALGHQHQDACFIGSLKTNIGHLESAAGIGATIKVIQMLQHQYLPKSLHADRLNPFIDFANSPFKVLQQGQKWQPIQDQQGNNQPLRAGVSSFGFGGSNAHLVLEAAPKALDVKPDVLDTKPNRVRPYDLGNLGELGDLGDLGRLFPLSAKTPKALIERARQLSHFLQQQPTTDLSALAVTLQLGRDSMQYRQLFYAEDTTSLIEQLDEYVTSGQRFETQGSFSLVELASQWLHGQSVNWQDAYTRPEWLKIPRLSLPTYPFAGPHYWIAADKPSAVLENNQKPQQKDNQRLRLHPLVHQNISDFLGQRFFSEFQGDEFFLNQHLVHQQKILPGVAYLEMARVAVELSLPAGEHLTAFKKMLWQRPLRMPSGSFAVVVELDEISATEIAFQIRAYEHPQQQFCEGKAIIGQRHPLAVVDLLPIQQSCTKAYKGDHCYAELKQLGLDYGPAFQRIDSLWVGSNQVLAKLKPPEAECQPAGYESGFCLPPTVLDSALQAAFGLALGEPIPNKDQLTRVPFALERLVLGNMDLLKDPILAWIRPATHANSTHNPTAINHTAINHTDSHPIDSQPSGNITRLDVDLVGNSGEVALSFRGFTSKALPLTSDHITLCPCWLPFDLANKVANQTSMTSDRHPWLLLITDSATSEDWLADWQQAVKHHPQYHQASYSTFKFKNPTKSLVAQAEYLYKWLSKTSLSTDQKTPFLQILCIGAAAPETLKQVLHRLCSESLPAFLTSAQQEGLIEGWQMVEITGQCSVQQSFEFAEKALPLTSKQLRITKEQTSQPKVDSLRWRPFPLQAGSVLKGAGPVWKSGGVYLITGGLGQLGLHLATAIAQQTEGVSLVLASRRTEPLNAATAERVQQIQHQGANVHLMALDLTQAKAVKDAIADIQQRIGTLTGVFHCAGITRDALLRNKSFEDFAQVLAPKVSGIWHLDRSTAAMPLEFFVVFSSVSAVMGTPGQSDYALANAFMDAFVHWRQQQVDAGNRQGRSLSINWPLWLEGGMSVSSTAIEHLYQQTGIAPLSTQSAMASLAALLKQQTSNSAQWLVLAGDQTRIKTFLTQTGVLESEEFDEDAMPIPTQAVKASIPTTKASIPTTKAASHREAKPALVEFLTQLLSQTLERPTAKIDPDASFEKYGADSILLTELTRTLESHFGSLSNTLVYEYQSIQALAGYLLEHHPQQVAAKVQFNKQHNEQYSQQYKEPYKEPCKEPSDNSSQADPIKGLQRPPQQKPDWAHNPTFKHQRRRVLNRLDSYQLGSKEVAIIGISGRYPGAETLEVFWEKIAEGSDLITEVPKERWDHSKYFDEDPARLDKTYSRWGSFLDNVEAFDPLFFNLSPKEAVIINPNDRLFLEDCWNLLERSGLTREQIKQQYQNKVGVFVGAMYQQYQAFEADTVRESLVSVTSYSAIANRVSYFFGFQGPSIAVDTMCSSAISAIHSAIESLFNGDCSLAIAGAVNLSLHPKKYIGLSAGRVLGSRRDSRSFAAGDGYLPAEGVGTVLLKPLAAAKRDGDRVLAVIKGTKVNHNGHTHGFSIPSVEAQVALMQSNFEASGVTPDSISCIEAAANGSQMGDAIELSALQRVFGTEKSETEPCALGSVKSNFGHGEAVSGMMQLTKLVLQLQHKQWAPTLILGERNPKVSFANSRFHLQETLSEWPSSPDHPRRAMLNALGAGGSNGHLIVEEFQEEASHIPQQLGASSTYLIPLSARTPGSLLAYLPKLLAYLEKNCTQMDAVIQSGNTNGASTHLNDTGSRITQTNKTQTSEIQTSHYSMNNTCTIGRVAYSLQQGREAMECRLMLLANTIGQLMTQLQQLIAKCTPDSIETYFSGRAQQASRQMVYANTDEVSPATLSLLSGEGGMALCEQLINADDSYQLALFWCQGGDIPWQRLSGNLYSNTPNPLLSLPTYAFERQVCWLTQMPVVKVDTVKPKFMATKPKPPSGAQFSSETRLEGVTKLPIKVKTLVSEVLGVDTQTLLAHKPLSAYGLDSISMTQLVMKLQLEVCSQLQYSELLACRTLAEIEQLTEYRLAASGAASTGGIVPAPHATSRSKGSIEIQQLNAVGTGRPVFWFHGALGGCDMYRPLAAAIARPFYAVNARGWMSDREPIEGITAMAAYYVTLIESVQNDGSFDLGGYSLGGMLAYECARQLQHKGRSVNSIIMLDTPDVTGDRTATLSDKTRFLQTINMALQMTLAGEADRFREVLIHRDEVDLTQPMETYRLQVTTLARARGLKHSDHRLLTLTEQDTRIQQAYQVEEYRILPLPNPNDIQCYYFRNTSGLWLGPLEPYFATDSKEFAQFDRSNYWSLWQQQLPKFNVIDVDAACHMTLLTEPDIFQKIAEFCQAFYCGERLSAKF